MRRISFFLIFLISFTSTTLPSIAASIEGKKCSVRDSTKKSNGIYYYCNYRNSEYMIWQRDYNKSPESNSATDAQNTSNSECNLLKKYVRTKQKRLTSIVNSLNSKILIAKRTYQSSDIQNYLNINIVYTKMSWNMLNEISMHDSCYSIDKYAEIESSKVGWSQDYGRLIVATPLDVDPGFLRVIKSPKTYEWLFG